MENLAAIKQNKQVKRYDNSFLIFHCIRLPC